MFFSRIIDFFELLISYFFSRCSSFKWLFINSIAAKAAIAKIKLIFAFYLKKKHSLKPFQLIDRTNGGSIKNDFLSGITVALALVPEAVAFAFVAGISPVVGLYGAFMMGLVTVCRNKWEQKIDYWYNDHEILFVSRW